MGDASTRRFQVLQTVDSPDADNSLPPIANGTSLFISSMNMTVSESEFPQCASTFSDNQGQSEYGSNKNFDDDREKSFRHFTLEALPRLDNYRNMLSVEAAYRNSRPTLDALRGHEEMIDQDSHAPTAVEMADCKSGTVKFGWIKGVFVRCLLNIWGVMLFLRVSWVVGQAGILEAFAIIFLATAVTFLTAISMSAISTNGQIKGGGTYYMISRSLGPEFGASIGLIFALANAIAVAMYTVGFAESLVDLLKSFNTYLIADPTNSIRIIGTAAVIVQTGIVIVGMEWEAKAQIGLLFILVAAMIDFVIGSIIGPLSTDELSKGFTGFNATVFVENVKPAFRFSEGVDQNFFSVFSIFFPAATGILAGSNISADLRDPQVSIPKGTLLAILVTTLSYLAFAAIAGSTVVRDATGPLLGLENMTSDEAWEFTLAGFRNCNSVNETCQTWGLMNNFQVMELVSLWGPLIYAGCFAATLSSALASLVSAPKVFQALCKDKLYPKIEFFAKGYGKNNEPIRGYILTFFIAWGFILIANLNSIAPLISNFFLAAYALINFSTFHAEIVKPVGWRPTFKYYNKWLSLIGFVLCVGAMFLISWVTALLTFATILCLYLIVIYRKPVANWGTSTQAQTYKNALMSVQQLNDVDEHVKNYRPQILLLSGLPYMRPSLVDFAYLITKNLSLVVCGQIGKGQMNNRTRTNLNQKVQKWFQSQKMKAFFCPVENMDFEEGANAFLQTCGIGKLRPNILLMGYKNDWTSCKRSDLIKYFNVIHKALDRHVAVAVLRIEGGLDFSSKIIFDKSSEKDKLEIMADFNPNLKATTELSKSRISLDAIRRIPSQLSFSFAAYQSSASDLQLADLHLEAEGKHSKEKKEKISPIGYRTLEGEPLSRELMEDVMRFQQKYKHGKIDVYWLYDDGGLTLLLPYIINTRSKWSSCKLRVFTLANKKDELDAEQRSMAKMLSKFRIDYSDLRIIQDFNTEPQPATREFFEKYISPFRQKEGEKINPCDEGTVVTDEELISMKEKTNRHMRLRELLLKHSRGSSLIVMTLPMPRKGLVSAPLYMSWLELLTKDMPPFLLARGNQSSVLTFYS